jgi:hypothetical protein
MIDATEAARRFEAERRAGARSTRMLDQADAGEPVRILPGHQVDDHLSHSGAAAPADDESWRGLSAGQTWRRTGAVKAFAKAAEDLGYHHIVICVLGAEPFRREPKLTGLMRSSFHTHERSAETTQ